MSTVDEIKVRIDIVDLISETVKLRRSGKNYIGFCPFHDNKRTPAFVVFPDSGTWRCFGQCNEGGDIFKFVMKKEGWDFPETLQYLANRAGIEVEPVTPEKKDEDEQADRLREILEDAVIFFRHHLQRNLDGQIALSYLQQRGVKETTIDLFELGYAPDSWDACMDYFRDKGVSMENLVSVGLVTERQGADGYYDRFRNRLMFPIRDSMGRISGFGARALLPDDVPKYLNSPQTDLFDKGKLLYGFHLARKAIRAQNQAVIVEGYLDVIVPHQAGFTNHVSPMGTALTEAQLRQIKRFSRKIILALDADSAGEKATLRGLEVARQALDHSSDIGFDARGLLRQEVRLKADLRVSTLPDGMDPDEIVLRDADEWQAILNDAKPIVVHVIEALTAGRQLDDAKIKSEIVARVLPLIEDVPNIIERDAYRQRLARLLHIDERVLLGVETKGKVQRVRINKRSQKNGMMLQQPASELVGDLKSSTDLTERICLQFLIRLPDTLYLIDRVLQKAELARFSPQDFTNINYQEIAQLIQKSLEQEHVDPKVYLLENIPQGLEEIFEELNSPIKEGEPSRDRLIKYLILAFLRLRQIQNNEAINQLRIMREDMLEQGDDKLDEYKDMENQHIKIRAKIDKIMSNPLQFD